MRCLLSRTVRTAVGTLTLALLVAVAGCGPKTGTVSGKVTYKGEPLKGGNVIFASEKGQSLLAPIGEDGTYTIQNVPVGEAKIAVKTKHLGIVAAMAKMKGAGGPPQDTSGGVGAPKKLTPEEAVRRFVAIPAQYEDTETSGLTFTVKGGSQSHDIPLTGNLGTGKGSGGGPKQ